MSDLNGKAMDLVRDAAALLLLEKGAVTANVKSPYRLTSGNFSPIYIDCRKMISDLTFMRLFTVFAGSLVVGEKIRADLVAGGETAGIPFAAFVSRELAVPMIYVRKASKDHGIQSRIEGCSPQGLEVLLVEDLITDAQSKMAFIEAIANSGGTVRNVLVVFDRQQGGREALLSSSINLYSMTDLSCVLSLAKSLGHFSEPDMESILKYLADPRAWHEERGFAFKRE